MVQINGEVIDVLQTAGASPDALIVQQADASYEHWAPLAVVEAKCRCPFHYQAIGTPPLARDFESPEQ
jgi:hypothetical protein